jgi:hypothetical protein
MADPDFIVTGEDAALGILRRDHLPAFASWFNDPRSVAASPTAG